MIRVTIRFVDGSLQEFTETKDFLLRLSELKEQGHDTGGFQVDTGSKFENCETEVIESSHEPAKPIGKATSVQGGAA